MPNPERRIPPDIQCILTALIAHGVRYVLFGSAGAVAYGADLTPGDLDICPDPAVENLARLAAVLRGLRAKPRHIPGWNTVETCQAWAPDPEDIASFDHLLETVCGDLDVVARPYGPTGAEDRFTYAQLVELAVLNDAFGIPVHVAALDDLIASKMSRRRAKDLAALSELERIKGLAERSQTMQDHE